LPPLAIPKILGRTLILHELARESMGTVYLALAPALNRTIVLRTLKPTWAGNTTFVARFTREAYAAAQLMNPHLAEIHDFGEFRGTFYWCTERVDGTSVDALARRDQAQPAAQAAAYVLQAARGLKCATDQGVVHRDLRPQCLIVNRDGLVKVSGLGLTMTPEVDESADIELDARSEIYSLGCVLYALLTGRLPFDCQTVAEIRIKQQTQPIPPPDLLTEQLPRDLSVITLRMLNQNQGGSYSDMGEVVGALEAFLGISSSSSFKPHSEQAETPANCACEFNASRSARYRRWTLLGIVASCVVLGFLTLLSGRILAPIAFLSLGALIALADFVLVGFMRKTPIFLGVQRLAFESSRSEWLTVVAAIAILAGLLMVLKLFWFWVALALAAVGIAVGLHAAFDRRIDDERRQPLEEVHGLVRALRGQGLDEHEIRQFVCQQSGEDWEEFFEALFGYDAMLTARTRWGQSFAGKTRPWFAWWRDPIAHWLNSKLAARRAAREVEILQRIEERSLESQGQNLVTARRKARRAAAAMVATAAEIRESIKASEGTIPVKRSIVQALHEAASKPERVLAAHEQGLLHEPGNKGEIVEKALGVFFGPKLRFLAGATLVAGCVAWMYQNAMISEEHAAALIAAAKAGDVQAMQSHAEASVSQVRAAAARETTSLYLPFVPEDLLVLVSSFGAGAAGLVLIFSAVFAGGRIALFAIPAAAISVLGPMLPLPTFGVVDPSLAPSILGAALMVTGVLFGRSKS
jgi:eukaryotic-like serine/threonine-protein kinase